MDWITTSGRSLDEAKSNALDQLGIVADEAEFEIINDVEKGLFGRIKTDARVRTRVKPKVPAQKDDRRRRSSGKSGGGGGNRSRNRSRGKGGGSGQSQQKAKGETNTGGKSSDDQATGKSDSNQSARNNDSSSNSPKNSGGGGRSRRNRGAVAAAASAAGSTNSTKKKDNVDKEFPREEQEAAALRFLDGVLGAFELSGAVAVRSEAAEDNAIELDVTGEELGLLVGPKGNTLNALQELTRTVVQREADGAKTDRLRVDVAGYRERRAVALANFARGVADDVVESGNEKVLEPMGPADRKIVHDALTDVEGVETGSEGEEPRRRVVIRPAS